MKNLSTLLAIKPSVGNFCERNHLLPHFSEPLPWDSKPLLSNLYHQAVAPPLFWSFLSLWSHFPLGSTPNITNEVIIHELVCKVWLAQEGTLLLTPSMVEFQPQWLKKQATERWLGTFCWRARLTIFPLEATLSWNPSR